MLTRRSLACLLWLAPAAFAVIVDRIAITVGTKVITESEIIRRIRLAAFQNGQVPDFSDTSRREAAQRLIDLKLVESEMDLGNYTRTPPARAKALLDAFTTQHFRSSPEALRLALASADLTPADLQAEFAEQADLLAFTNLRFRPAVEISEAEIEEYFHNHVESANAAKAGAAPVTLADARANIEQILIGERADLALDAWLRDQRTRTKIVYLEKELQ
jgi:hypothetical protein